MSRKGKFAKQAARGRRTFDENLERALSGLNLAALPAGEPVISRPSTETIQDKVARLRAHLEVYRNDGDARVRYQELTGLQWGVTETLPSRAPVPEASTNYGRPEFLGIGGGQNHNCEVYIPYEEHQLTEEEWSVLAQAAKFEAFGQ